MRRADNDSNNNGQNTLLLTDLIPCPAECGMFVHKTPPVLDDTGFVRFTECSCGVWFCPTCGAQYDKGKKHICDNLNNIHLQLSSEVNTTHASTCMYM
jgi:hypothetical protein